MSLTDLIGIKALLAHDVELALLNVLKPGDKVFMSSMGPCSLPSDYQAIIGRKDPPRLICLPTCFPGYVLCGDLDTGPSGWYGDWRTCGVIVVGKSIHNHIRLLAFVQPVHEFALSFQRGRPT